MNTLVVYTYSSQSCKQVWLALGILVYNLTCNMPAKLYSKLALLAYQKLTRQPYIVAAKLPNKHFGCQLGDIASPLKIRQDIYLRTPDNFDDSALLLYRYRHRVAVSF